VNVKYLKYKGVTVNALGFPVFSSNKKSTIKYGTPGRMYYQYRRFDFVFKRTAPKDLVVMYDIPSDMRKERDWLRYHLKKFDYTMVQKSVWVGPSPLPKDFLNYIKKIGLFDQLRTLKLAKPYSKRDRDM
jgi:DNA-binding transcriptional regulator PaaX